MPLVEMPVLRDRQPQAVHRVQGEVERADGAALYGGVGAREVDAGFLQELAGQARFFFTDSRQVDIPPAGEPVFQIPLALSVPHQRELRHHPAPPKDCGF